MTNKRAIIAMWIVLVLLGIVWVWADFLVDMPDGIGEPVGITFLALYLGCGTATIVNTK